MRLNYFLVRQIKENSLYLLILVAVIGYLVFLSWFVFANTYDNDAKTRTLQSEIADLTTRRDFINYQQTIRQQGIDIDAGNRLLSQLIPDQEDFFSLIYALDTISSQSQFIITGYALTPSSVASPLSITITGTGDSNSFTKFLSNYNFGGGRLITIDSIKYLTSYAGETSLRINLYSGKSATTPHYAYRFTDADKQLITRIMSKISVEIKNSTASAAYQTKQNPF